MKDFVTNRQSGFKLRVLNGYGIGFVEPRFVAHKSQNPAKELQRQILKSWTMLLLVSCFLAVSLVNFGASATCPHVGIQQRWSSWTGKVISYPICFNLYHSLLPGNCGKKITHRDLTMDCNPSW